MNIALISVFMAAAMTVTGGTYRYSVQRPQPVAFALPDAGRYCLRKMPERFQIVARGDPAYIVADVNRPFTSEPKDGIVFRIYDSRHETNAHGARQILTPVTLADCSPAAP